MKAAVDRAATARVLADIDAAVRQVERARTAAAVERVLATASRGKQAPIVTWGTIPDEVVPCQRGCDCYKNWIPRENATPGMVVKLPGPNGRIASQRDRYAPHVVSPHLFGGER